ncbi:hypothetical protein EIM50_16585 [Pseudoxanthomonas sp. SGD-10]|nr:hypothetical protein EIM50_16585 [Pseudoxanthomonas sp. SGD-10]
MKNLTAQSNIYYNASEILKQSETNITNAYRDDYNYILDIFIVPDESLSALETDNLNEVISRANRIALEKYESNWVDDAFLLLAKAEYWKGNFYNASEYFSYVSQNFPTEKKNTVEALVWQGKTLFALNKYKEADSVLQLAYAENIKHYRAELNAALAHSYLLQDRLDEAEMHLQKSVDFARNRYSKIRWSYILAQVQEKNGNTSEAYKNYATVVKSNAAFEMSFNANLAQIRLRESASGVEFDRIATLKKLLKEDKNASFTDQIYYQIAKTYEAQDDLDNAMKYYSISAQTVPGSPQQKGLAYLSLAEINFFDLKDYAKAQLYYDSTLQVLPPEYPEYNTISLKAKNLQYLADRLTTIERERELLMLAKLSEEERIAFAENKIKSKIEEEQEVQDQAINALSTNTPPAVPTAQTGSFYFDNSIAIAQGSSEFKRRWGNRKLEDNWRVSAGVSLASAPSQAITDVTPNPSDSNAAVESLEDLRNEFLKDVPLTAEAQTASLNKIRTARYEIAMFYKEVLNDNQAAITELEQLLEDYTLSDAKVPELYYQLYRLYADVNPTRSNQYRDEITNKFPESIYAKSIINPDFGKEEQAIRLRLNEKYNTIYDTYTNRKYNDVIQQINSLESSLINFPAEAPKFAYLKALAVGNTQKAPAFVSHLEEIVEMYPQDTVITPLVQSQLQSIAANRSVFYNRNTALLSHDANEYFAPRNVKITESVEAVPDVATPKSPLTEKEPALSEQVQKQVAVAPKDKEVPVSKETSAEEANTNVTEAPKEPAKPKEIAFSNNIRIRHAVVIDIKDASMNVAKPFAGITKHFYSKFAPASVNLSVRTIGTTDKLIIVRGPFLNKDQAATALNELSGLLPEILELKSSDYRTFVISDPNLLLINNTESLEQYLNFIK